MELDTGRALVILVILALVIEKASAVYWAVK